jgi:hypothetical protein
MGISNNIIIDLKGGAMSIKKMFMTVFSSFTFFARIACAYFYYDAQAAVRTECQSANPVTILYCCR